MTKLKNQKTLKMAYSQKVFQFGSNLKKKVPNRSPEHLLFRWIVFWGVIWHLFVGDLSQSEKLSDIKPPLELSKSEQD